MAPSTDHDVVIVGAGAAGLYAAYTLDNLGYDVLILEATARHGGRVYSDALGDVGIEHGAEELYGATNNFVYNDVRNEYGSGAQTKIWQENPQQDSLIVMDADGLGGRQHVLGCDRQLRCGRGYRRLLGFLRRHRRL